MKQRSFAARLREIDWDAVAGIAAAFIALVLHLLHVVEEGLLLAIILVVLALLLLRDIRRESADDRLQEGLEATAAGLRDLRGVVAPADAILVGPQRLRASSEDFAANARGEMIWFNVCLLMFRPQSLFDSLLRPAIENPAVTRIQFVLDEGERENWAAHVAPKVADLNGAEKVMEPRWCTLREAVSFVLGESKVSGAPEAQLSFWGEPFMAHTTTQDVPRYVFHVQPHSELIPHLYEMERRYRLGG